jgi:hypothetical protein
VLFKLCQSEIPSNHSLVITTVFFRPHASLPVSSSSSIVCVGRRGHGGRRVSWLLSVESMALQTMTCLLWKEILQPRQNIDEAGILYFTTNKTKRPCELSSSHCHDRCKLVEILVGCDAVMLTSTASTDALLGSSNTHWHYCSNRNSCGLSCDAVRTWRIILVGVRRTRLTRLVQRKRRSSRRAITWQEILKTQFSGILPTIFFRRNESWKLSFWDFLPRLKTEFWLKWPKAQSPLYCFMASKKPLRTPPNYRLIVLMLDFERRFC